MNITRFADPGTYLQRWGIDKADPTLGFGRLEERLDDGVVLRYVDIPRASEHRVLVPFVQVHVPPRLPQGCRVWIKDQSFGFWSGHVEGMSGLHYRVWLNSDGSRKVVPYERLLVRWSGGTSDPALALQHGFFDHPGFYEVRWPLRRELLRHQQFTRGYGGALSAPIRLYGHQVDVMARVLGDPWMRYLLADEVGLGKTIEAGLVIRQLLHDSPKSRVVIAVPRPLVDQWRDELSNRLMLVDQVKTNQIRIVAHEQLADVRLVDAECLVVDEVHRVAGDLIEDSRTNELVTHVHGLLVLSATPLRGDPETLKKIFSAVDATAFSAMSAEDFSARLEGRAADALQVSRLRARIARIEAKHEALEQLLEKYPGDQHLHRLGARARAVADARDPVWSQLSDYVKETYRISRRMIRQRREIVTVGSFDVAGRRQRRIPLSTVARPVISDFLQRLVRGDVEADDSVRLELIEAGLAGAESMRAVAARHLRSTDLADSAQEELRALDARLALSGDEARVAEALEQAVGYLERGQRVVIATSYPEVAALVATRAASRFGDRRVMTYFHGDGNWSPDQEIWDFIQSDEGCVLVCDALLEEGRNLQGSACMIHMDLPLDANRLEQRIGRVDRHAQDAPAAECVVFEEDDPWVAGQIALLGHGLRIFDESAAGIQLTISDLSSRLAQDLLAEGSAAFDFDSVELSKRLDDDRAQSDYLEDLESSQAAGAFDGEDFQALLEGDAEEEVLVDAIRRATSHVTFGLPLRIKPVSRHGQSCFSFEVWKTLGQDVEVTERLRSLVEGNHYTPHRDLAASQDGLRLLRAGEPIMDWISDELQRDPEGMSYAFVRQTSGMGRPTLVLVADLVARCNPAFVEEWAPADRRRLLRRATALFPPFHRRIAVDHLGNMAGPWVTAGATEIAKSDVALDGAWRERIANALPDWSTDLAKSASAARRSFVEHADLAQAKESGLERLDRQTSGRVRVLTSRGGRLPSADERTEAAEELTLERRLADRLRESIEDPEVSVMAAGAVVLWPEGVTSHG